MHFTGLSYPNGMKMSVLKSAGQVYAKVNGFMLDAKRGVSAEWGGM